MIDVSKQNIEHAAISGNLHLPGADLGFSGEQSSLEDINASYQAKARAGTLSNSKIRENLGEGNPDYALLEVEGVY